jgi:hypothetical protein
MWCCWIFRDPKWSHHPILIATSSWFHYPCLPFIFRALTSMLAS